MPRYELSSAAAYQLNDIYEYTLKQWGRRQAKSYVNGILSVFDKIASGKAVGRAIPAAYEIDGFFITYRKHFIYWQKFEDGIIGIFAILHQQQSQGDNLAESYKESFG